LGLGDLGGDGFDLAVDGGKEVGDLGLFRDTKKGQSRMARTLGVCSSIWIEVYIEFHIDI